MTGAQTVNWTGNNGDVWERNLSWSTNQQPNTGSIAVIEDGPGTSIALRDGSSGAVSAGTLLLLNNGTTNYYELTRGATAATLNFGSGSTSLSGLDFNSSNSLLNTFTLGDGSSFNISVPGTWTARTAAGQAVIMQGRIVGAGSVAYGRIPSTGSADAEILIDSSAPAGTYTGGTTLGPNTLLTARISSSGSPGSLTNGPVGTGTFVFNGGTLLLDRGSGTSIFSNTIRATADSTLNAVTHGRVLDGDIGLTVGSGTTSVGYRLSTGANSTITFSNATYSSADVGTIAFNSTTANGLTFDVTSGTSVFGGAVGELAPTEEGMVVGGSHMTKTGGGVFAARTFRSYVIEIQQPGSGTLVSTLRANQSSSGGIFGTPDFIGHIDGTIRCGSLLIASSSGVPTAVLDLQNNDMIIDWKAGANPLGTITYNSGGTTVTATGHVAQIRNAWANGSWTGTGITSGVAAANTASFAIGYADAATFYGLSPGGTATFSGQTVDDESSIFKFTYKGDFNLDGQVNVNDSGIIGANWNTDQQWTGGDANYDGRANVSDYALMAANFNAGQGAGNQLRGGEGVLPLTELYIWMLDYPQIYWESRDWTDFWDQYFAPFEGLNLGEIPARPEGMRSVPEPAALAISLLLLPRRRRK